MAEPPDESEFGQSEITTDTATTAAQEDTHLSKVVVLVGLCLLLAAVITAIVAVSNHYSRDDEDGDGEGMENDQPSFPSGGNGYVTTPTTPKTDSQPTTSKTDSRPTTSETDSPPTNPKTDSPPTTPKADSPPTTPKLDSPTTTPKTASPTTTPKAASPKMLVCTFGHLGVLPAMIPPDGTCDIIFYEEVYYNQKKKSIQPTHSARSFHVLQSLNATYTMTTFGTSMATGAIAQSVHNDKADVMAAMETLFASGMVHFGMLNVADFENYKKGGSMLYLQVVDEFLRSKGDSTRHCALGVSLTDGTQGKVILEKSKEATVDFPGITMVIIKLHAGKVASAADLWPVGPNPDGADLSRYKILTLKTLTASLGGESLKDKLQDISQGTRWTLLSFSMAVRAYRMRDNWRAPAMDQLALRAIEMDYATVCKQDREKTQSDDVTNYAYDAGAKFLAMFDDKETFRTKTRERVKLLPESHGGIAVYKVESDDFVGDCNGGEKFVRLKSVREALM